jgi:CRISPR type I-E-associated protein CasA/Cse1
MPDQITFNLLHEPWIPILRQNGKAEKVGILAALTQAALIRQIAASNPLDNVSLLRLLLALLIWSKSRLSREELESIRQPGTLGIPIAWLQQLITQPDTFDLFDETQPFLQDPQTQGNLVAATNLLIELPSATNIAHFRHTRDASSVLCSACCALGLVRWSAVASAGTAGAGVSMTASLHGNAPAYYISAKSTLLATLLNNWPPAPFSSVSDDMPVWAGANQDSPLGLLKGLTWRTRRVRLVADMSPQAVCCNCGASSPPLVKQILFRPGWERPRQKHWSADPHLLLTARRRPGTKRPPEPSTPAWPSPNAPLDEKTSVWRDVLRGLLQHKTAASPPHPNQDSAFRVTLLGNSQQLYKHAATIYLNLPAFTSPKCPEILLAELDWLESLLSVTAAPRASLLRDKLRDNRIIPAIYQRSTSAVALRSTLCNLSPQTESALQSAFLDLAGNLAPLTEPSGPDAEPLQNRWRIQTRRILHDALSSSLSATAPGSPLRKREVTHSAAAALDKSMENRNVRD